MKTLRLITLIASSMFLINCGGSGQADKAHNTNGQSERGIPMFAAANSDEAETLDPSDVLTGRIFRNDSWNGANDSQEVFQSKIESFLSPQFLLSEVGSVNGDEAIDHDGYETGVTFWGRGFKYADGSDVDLNADLRTGRNLISVDSAELRINIFQKLSSGSIQEVPIHFNRLNGELDKNAGQLVDSLIQEVQGGYYVQLIFADSLGKVNLSGYVTVVNGQTKYVGLISFRNLKTKTTSGLMDANHQPEILGKFSVPACGFFKCSQAQ